MSKLIAMAGGQLELFIAIGKRYKVFRQIKELLRDEMEHLTFTLYPSVDRHHRRAEHDALAFSDSVGQTTRFAGPVSSSMVMNINPFADPGFCRTKSRPAIYRA